MAGDRPWSIEDHEKAVAVDGRRKEPKIKVECVTWNYQRKALPATAGLFCHQLMTKFAKKLSYRNVHEPLTEFADSRFDLLGLTFRRMLFATGVLA